MRTWAWTVVGACILLAAYLNSASVSAAAVETCVVGDAVILEADFTSQAPSGLPELSWAYHGSGAYFTLKSIAQADDAPISRGPDFGALQIRWMNGGSGERRGGTGSGIGHGR